MTARTASSVARVIQNLDTFVFALGIENTVLPENSESLLGMVENGSDSVGKHLVGEFAFATNVFTVGAGSHILVKLGMENNWGLVT